MNSRSKMLEFFKIKLAPSSTFKHNSLFTSLLDLHILGICLASKCAYAIKYFVSVYPPKIRVYLDVTDKKSQ